MRITWDSDEPMDEHEMRAVARLVDAGKLTHGETVNRLKLAELLGCRHEGAPCVPCLDQLN